MSQEDKNVSLVSLEDKNKASHNQLRKRTKDHVFRYGKGLCLLVLKSKCSYDTEKEAQDSLDSDIEKPKGC